MAIETDDWDSCAVSKYLDWALETGIWNGRNVSWMEASDFCHEVKEKIAALFLERSAAGTLLGRDIQELDFSKSDLVLPAGFKKSLNSFWKKHKKEILITAAVVAVITVVVIVAVSTVGTGSGPAAAAGASAIAACGEDDPRPLPKPVPKLEPVKETKTEIPRTENIPQLSNQLAFNETGIFFDQEFVPYENVLTKQPDLSNPPNLKQKSWIADFLDIVGRGIIDSPELLDPEIPLPEHPLSSRFSTIGKRDPHIGIGGINGINTTLEEAMGHADHLSQLAHGHAIDWIHNNSHGPLIDIGEVLVCNYSGYSPNTADLLLEQWTAFHEQNKHRPKAKFLQFCHSQGTIHARNALLKASPEIRNRMYLKAFGPAVMISENLCFKVEHYACKGDVVPLGEMAFAGITGRPIKTLEAIDNLKKIIWVDPAPDTKSPHDFQNPAFYNFKMTGINDHILRNGEYDEIYN